MALESTSLFLKVGEFGFKKEREEKRKPKKIEEKLLRRTNWPCCFGSS